MNPAGILWLFFAGTTLLLRTASSQLFFEDGERVPAVLEDSHGERASISLSSGTLLHGTLRLPRGRSLEIFDTERGKRYRLSLKEIRRVDVTVEKEWMQNAWRFKEEGDPEKIILPETYPIRKYLTRITLCTGEVLTGHSTAVLYLKEEEEETRIFLLSHQKGEKGETLSDLVYVRSVALGEGLREEEKAGDLFVLRGEIPLAEEIAAVDLLRSGVHHGKAEGRPGSFEIKNLLPGRYTLVLLYPHVLLSGPLVLPPGDGREAEALSEEEQRGVREKILSVEEFFHEKKLLWVEGKGSGAWAFVESVRTRPTSLKDKESGESYRFLRWDLFHLVRVDKKWEIRDRLFLFRKKIHPSEELPCMGFQIQEKLGVLINGKRGKKGKGGVTEFHFRRE